MLSYRSHHKMQKRKRKNKLMRNLIKEKIAKQSKQNEVVACYPTNQQEGK